MSKCKVATSRKEKRALKRYGCLDVFKDRRGINTVEIVIILAVFIGLILIFKDYITEFLQKIFNDMDQDTERILNMIMPFIHR